MVKCCAVRDCINFRGQVNFQSDGYPVNYFAFPNPVKEPDRFVRFCELCQCRQDNRQQLYICSEHFGSDDITGNRFLQPRLCKSALPCRNLPKAAGIELIEGHSLSSEPLFHDDAEVVVPELTLQQIVSSVELPQGCWSAKLCGDYAVFCELSITETLKPVITRSVTIDSQLNPTVFVGGCLVELHYPKPLQNIDNLSSFLITVSSLPLCKSSSLTAVAELIFETVAAYEHSADIEIPEKVCNDHCYATSVDNSANKATSDHSYVTSPVSSDQTSNADTAALYLATLKFIQLQCVLLSVTVPSRRRYEPAFLRWCLLIYFHSPAAYRAILESRCLVVPSERLLRHYSAPFTIQPGVHDARVQQLTAAANQMTTLERNVSLIVDEMYIKPEITYSSGRLSGFADNRLDAVPATTVLTFMVQSICGDFRDIVAFFPVYQLTGQDEAKYVRDSIAVIERSGLFVLCVVCDNSKVNQTMMKDFGIVTQDGVPTGVAAHPFQNDRQLLFIIDPCHLIKCIRNNWLDRCVFSIAGNNISIDYLRELYTDDKQRDIRLAPKLNTKVLHPTNVEKQCVRSAVTLFAPSVSAALETYMQLKPEEFGDAGPTVEFLKRIHRFWCWMNVQNVYQGQHSRDHHQQPFRFTSDFRLKEFDELKSWLVAWHRQAPASARLTNDTYAAFCITLESVKLLIIQLLSKEDAQFVLTGRVQQDPLEERFAAHRQRAGCSYNPSALQFQQTEKKMAILKSVTNSKNCNTARMEPGSNKTFWDNSMLPTAAKKTQGTINNQPFGA